MALFVDTETTGLPACMNAGLRMERNWPDVVQLAYCKGDAGDIVCRYLKPNQSMSPESVRVHGITPEFLQENGQEPKLVFSEFLEACSESEILVAHNIKFDRNVIISQILRLGLDPSPVLALSPSVHHVQGVCNHVRSWPRRVAGKVVYKMPRLEECAKFFNIRSSGSLHDARTDVDILRKLYNCLDA